MSHENKNLDFHKDDAYRQAVQARLATLRAQRQEEASGSRGILSGIQEMGPVQARRALAGVVAVAALVAGGDKLVQRFADVMNPHEVTRTHVEHHAVNPYDGNSDATTVLHYKQQVIGKP